MKTSLGILFSALAMSAVITLHSPLAFDGVAADTTCLAVGEWGRPTPRGVAPLHAASLYAEAARQRVVLLGEQHDSAEHHRWQLQMLAALHAQRPNMVIGFEMFPRGAQAVLDRWVAGELDEAAFLKQVDWESVWGFDANLYLPLFHFARMNRIPMLALNVDNALVREVGRAGLAAIPPARLEGVGMPAPVEADYQADLWQAYRMHRPHLKPHDAAAIDLGNPAFLRFQDAQLLRDRAFAEGIAQATRRPGAPLVVGIIGAGHMRYGRGVPQQLAALDEREVAVYLPHAAGGDCRELRPGYADALFGVRPPPSVAPGWRALLGVRIGDADGGVRIDSVLPDTPADAAGLRAGDLIVALAGLPVASARDITRTVSRQAPGTWLPVRAMRDGTPLELIAKFPVFSEPPAAPEAP